MKPRHVLGMALSMALSLSACKPQTPAVAAPAEPTPSAASPTTPVTVAGQDGQPNPSAPASVQGFDLSAVPVSDQPLGDFPYIGMPDDCEISTGPNNVHKLARAPFWTGDKLEWVEGQTLASYVSGKDGQHCNFMVLVRNLDSVVTQLGGRKVNESKISDAAWDELVRNNTANGPLEPGLQAIQSNPVATYVIRRADRAIWIQAIALHTGDANNVLVTETTPLQISATVLPASALKQQIDKDGKVALQVNFATDKTEILSDSLPQIEQVVQLLKDDPALKLAINGHTDSTGDKAHNQTLSEGRAASVVSAITAHGIEASRLTAAGFGDTRPVADNDSEDGKARNRRVELVKQ